MQYLHTSACACISEVWQEDVQINTAEGFIVPFSLVLHPATERLALIKMDILKIQQK